jgi:phage-related protein
VADVVWSAEVEGHAAESFDTIAGAADHAGDEVEKLDAKMKTVGQLKIDADIAGLEVKLETLRAELDHATGNRRILIEADIALAEAKLAALREQADRTDVAMRGAAGGSIGLWGAVAAAIVVAGGAALALGAAFGGILAIGILALHGLSGGFGTLTSAAQDFRFQLETLEQTTLQHLAAAAQSGLEPIAQALKAIRPELDALATPVKNFSDVLGTGLADVMKILTPLIGKMLDFGNLALQALGQLKQPLQDFATQFGAVLQKLNDSGQTQQAMGGLIGILSALLQLTPPLVEALVRLSAAFGPELTGAANATVAVLKPILDLISAFPRETVVLVDVLGGLKLAFMAAAAASKLFGEAAVASEAEAMATPLGLVIAAIAAVIFLLYELGTHWSQTVDAIGSGARAVGDFIVGIGKAILDFFQAIIDAVMAPFKAVGAMIGGIGSAIGSVGNVSIPGFAEGAIVTRPTVAMVAEGGEAEAVIPLSKLGNIGGGGGDVHVHVHNAVIGNSAELVKTVRTALQETAGRGHGYRGGF